MSILDIKKKSGYRLVGVHVSPPVHNFLTLYGLAKGVSKSTVFKEAIDQWSTNIDKVEGENDLMEQIIKRAYKKWKERKKAKPRADFNIYITTLQKELMQKGLTKEQTEQIIKGVQGYAKNK